MKIRYEEKSFRGASLEIVRNANLIIEEYTEQGYSLTLRQLYYQFVARGMLENSKQSYSRLGGIISDARMAGLVDWNAIEDRTRELKKLTTWASPGEVAQAAADGYREDKWADQRVRVEVWIEKEALSGVFQAVCEELEVPYFACRGYTSQSEMWRAGQRLRKYERRRQRVVILHFGDHDPSGIDMTRDIDERLKGFGCAAEVRRLALNMEQVREFDPPPNPAKVTDSRFEGYEREYGEESWELDALEPSVLAKLVVDAVLELRDEETWEESVGRQEGERARLVRAYEELL